MLLFEFGTAAKIVLIKAGAGVGKSTLAREFLQTHFKKVIRIEMGLESGNVTPAEEKVSQILRKDFDEEPSRDFGINLGILGEKLADRANPIGVLIDNLEPALDENYRFREKLRGYDALLTVLGDRDVFSFTLITSRRSLITPRAKVHEYSLEGLDITAWRQYFHDCENGADSESLMQMRDAYNGNAKVMDILHGAIRNRFDDNIGAYWSRYKDALLADSELETLISVEMDWLRDNQPDAYKLLCRMGCYRYQDVKTVPFEGLICLLWDVPESRQVWVVDYLSKTSLIEVRGEYCLHPVIRESTKSRLVLNQENWETTNLRISNFYKLIAGNLVSIRDAILYLEAIHHAIIAKHFSKALNLLIKNGEIYEPIPCARIRSFGYINTSINYLNCILQNYKTTNDYLGLIYLYGQLGDVYTLSGMLKDGIQSYENSLDLLIEYGVDYSKGLQKDYCVDVKGALALTYFYIGENLKSENLFQDCLKDAQNLDEDGYKYICYIYACLAFLACEAKEYPLAKEFIDKALKFLKYLDNTYHTWIKNHGLYYLSRSLITSKMFSEAEYILVQLHAFAKQYSYCVSENLTILGEAYLYASKNDNISSLHKFLSIKIKYEKIGNSHELADIYFQIGLTYQAMGEHDQAEEYKAKALELFAQMEAPKQIERVNKAFGGNIQ